VQKRWVIAATDSAAAQALAAELDLPLPLAQVLINRGLRDADSARRFLDPQLRQLGDPFALPAMAAAIDRLRRALRDRERIVVYGDYDVDGVTASALLTQVLRAAGATVANFLPHRLDEGYGLSADGLSRCCREHQPQLLIAVDCGTSSCREIAALAGDGVDVIILDHHEPPAELPACIALVNPKLAADNTPLASVGVALKFAHALLKTEPSLQAAVDLRQHLDLVALGTVADIVPLTGENRILVRAGLERLARTDKVGLRALMDVAGVEPPVTPYHIGFRLGPRLNAAGRLADAMAALELLLTSDRRRATELARQLHEHNADRQRVEEQIVASALAQAERFANDHVLVLADPNWHVGVIGIVASRVLQEYYRPTVVIGADGKGSCRSIAGFSIIASLRACASVLEQFGGHEMAAGLRVRGEDVAAFRQAINAHAGQVLRPEDLQPPLTIDAVVRLDELDPDFFAHLRRFEPCGAENPAPLFAVTGIRVRGQPRVVGREHLKFFVTDGASVVEAIWFGAGAVPLPAGEFDMAFHTEVNEFRGQRTVQLRVRDVRPEPFSQP